MQGHLAALASKYDIYLVPYITKMHYVSLKSHRTRLYYDISIVIINHSISFLLTCCPAPTLATMRRHRNYR